MSNQAQVDALEHLLIAVLNSTINSVPTAYLFESAQGSLMGSNGPGGPEQKSKAVEYLNYIRGQIR